MTVLGRRRPDSAVDWEKGTARLAPIKTMATSRPPAPLLEIVEVRARPLRTDGLTLRPIRPCRAGSFIRQMLSPERDGLLDPAVRIRAGPETEAVTGILEAAV